MSDRRSARDERAVTVPMTYVLVLGITTLLASGLFFATGTLVDNQQERMVRSGLEVAGSRVGAELAAADRLARTVDGDGTVEATVELPDRIAGSSYRIRVSREGTSDVYDIELVTAEPEIAVTVSVRSETPIENATVPGGDLRVRYASDTDSLEVAHA